MLRKDTKFMLDSDWEPKVPSKEIMQRQVKNRTGKIAGSVRLALGKVAVKK